MAGISPYLNALYGKPDRTQEARERAEHPLGDPKAMAGYARFLARHPLTTDKEAAGHLANCAAVMDALADRVSTLETAIREAAPMHRLRATGQTISLGEGEESMLYEHDDERCWCRHIGGPAALAEGDNR